MSIRNNIEENKEKIIKEILLLKEQIDLNSFTPIHKRLDSGSEITLTNLNQKDIRRTELLIKIKKIFTFKIVIEDNLMGRAKYIFRNSPETGSYLNIEWFDHKFNIELIYDYHIYKEAYILEPIRHTLFPFIDLTHRNEDEIEEYRKNENEKRRNED